ncbi:hypothetical protein EDB86DRAFT_2134803 [Lactarius hatsudake]|nr:hypothetical protein EDB86DRAFT_2134803 [Lactarius hatsudake]
MRFLPLLSLLSLHPSLRNRSLGEEMKRADIDPSSRCQPRSHRELVPCSAKDAPPPPNAWGTLRGEPKPKTHLLCKNAQKARRPCRVVLPHQPPSATTALSFPLLITSLILPSIAHRPPEPVFALQEAPQPLVDRPRGPGPRAASPSRLRRIALSTRPFEAVKTLCNRRSLLPAAPFKLSLVWAPSALAVARASASDLFLVIPVSSPPVSPHCIFRPRFRASIISAFRVSSPYTTFPLTYILPWLGRSYWFSLYLNPLLQLNTTSARSPLFPSPLATWACLSQKSGLPRALEGLSSQAIISSRLVSLLLVSLSLALGSTPLGP